MNPNIAANQQRLFLAFVAELRPHIGRDSALPRRIRELFARHRAIGSRDRKLYRELVYTYLRFLPWIDPLLGPELKCRAAALGSIALATEAGRHADSPAQSGPATSTGPTNAELAAKITAWLAPELKPTSAYRAAHCADWPPVPDTLDAKAAVLGSLLPSSFLLPPSPEALLPAWFQEHCPAAFTSPHLDALNSRAGVWVRIQCNDRTLVLDEFRARQWTFDQPADFPDALCLPPNAEVAGSDAYRRGFIEIQDLGSQLVLACAPITPGGRWLDACAGAGGKTLQLARLLGDAGHVDATDIRPDILDELDDRAKRARLTNITIVPSPVIARRPASRDDDLSAVGLAKEEAIHPFRQAQGPEPWSPSAPPQAGKPVEGLDHHGALRAPCDDKTVGELYDGILVDAPCSGSGTWRRQPHLKWYVKPESITSFTKTQREILTAHAPRVKPGGLLIYATCSLSLHENHDVVATFLSAHPQFQPEPSTDTHGGTFDGLGTLLLPGTRNTDGFYVSLLRRAR